MNRPRLRPRAVAGGRTAETDLRLAFSTLGCPGASTAAICETAAGSGWNAVELRVCVPRPAEGRGSRTDLTPVGLGTGAVPLKEVLTALDGLPEMPDGLADDIARTGGRLIHSSLDPLADLIRVQRLAVALAETRGQNPDRPRNLTRSVILT